MTEGIDHQFETIHHNLNHSSESEPSESRPLLRITSYGHRNGPLQPIPALTFDLRNLPNPPKHVRSSQSGLFKPLQEWLFSHSEVQQRYSTISTIIEERLSTAKENREMEVSIGVCCQLGRHRSVAFVEELGRSQWEGWDVVIGHRDLNRQKGGSDREKRRRREEGNSKHRNRLQSDFE